MSHASDAAALPRRTSACVHPWCDGQFCINLDQDERFHRGILSSEGDTDIVGVEIVANDNADGTSTGPLIDITFTTMSSAGVALHSAGLPPDAALRHIAAVAQAVSLALAPR